MSHSDHVSTSDLGPVIVTGGSRGIGAATVEALTKAGRSVAFSYASNDTAANALCDKIAADGGKALAVKGDAADPAAVDHLFKTCRDKLGPATGLFANAGISGPYCTLEHLSLADLQRVMEVNVTGTFLAAQAAIREMTANENQKGGAIVFMSSRAAQLGGGGEWVHYAASKGAVDSMTVGLANEVGPLGIRVNAVSPGLIETELHASSVLSDRLKQKSPHVPLGRSGTAEEVAETVCWLLSDKASYVSGAILNVAGGR